jgi:carbonic anhydrase
MSVNIHAVDEVVTDWKIALQYLKDGNKRFLEGQPVSRIPTVEEMKIMAAGQTPFAAVVTCSDSRIAPEIFFDQRLGDIFVIRNSGNIANTTVLGSVEFVVDIVKVPLVVVVAHTDCRAVISAFNTALTGGEYPDNLQRVMNTIILAVKDCNSAEEAILANLDYTVKRIKKNKIVEQTGAMVVGAFFDIGTGEVQWE